MSAEDQAKLYVKRVLDLFDGSGKPKLAFMGVEVATSSDMLDNLEDYAKKAGVEVVLGEMLPRGDTDFTPQIIKLKQSGADYVVMHALTSQFVTFLRDTVRLGASHIPVIATFTGGSQVIPETLGKERMKNYTTMQSYSPYATNSKPGMKELVKYAETHKVDSKFLADLWYVQGWTCAKVFVEAVRRAGKELTRETLITSIESIKDFDSGGLSGPMTFGPNETDGMKSARFYYFDFDKAQWLPKGEWYQAK
jgi:branched-chain amino acid transport system substrate-binding protein